jgi:CxxC motif-containing protein (DUF1111 family)
MEADDLETGDGIVQAGPQDTANKLRTAPRWGLRMRPRFMHDLKSLTLESAIGCHKGEAEDVTERFFDLTEAQKQQLFTFLNSLWVMVQRLPLKLARTEAE